MKKVICLILAAALMMGLNLSVARAAEEREPVFGSVVAVGSDVAYVVKQDGSLWVWGEPWAKNETQIKWPAKLTENVISTCNNDSYHYWDIVLEKADGKQWMVDQPEVWPAELTDTPLTPGEPFDPEEMTGYSCFPDGPGGTGLVLEQGGTLWYVEFDGSFPINKDEDEMTEEVLLSEMTRTVKIMDDVVNYKCRNSVVYFLKKDETLWEWIMPDSKGAEPPIEKSEQIMNGVVTLVGNLWNYYAQREDGTIWAINAYRQAKPEMMVEENVVFHWDACCEETFAIIKKDGSLWMWGFILSDGDEHGTILFKDIPTKVMDDVVDLSLGNLITMAVKSDGTLWAWGGAYGHYPRYFFPDDPVNEKDHPTPVKLMDGVAIPGTPAHFPSSWAKDEVALAESAGLVPTDLQSWYQHNITRAEFCALAVALYEKVTGKEIMERQSFTDTTDVNVEKMAAVGVVYGTSPDKFTPNGNLTREQAATMLARLTNAIGKPLAKKVPSFADNGSIADWALEAVGQVQAAGIMNGTGNNAFTPLGSYTREQSIVTILRMYDVVK